MIIYHNTKGGFISDVRNGLIAEKIENSFLEHCIAHYQPNKFGTDYNHASDKMCNIDALGVQQTKWNSICHDLHGNHQKLYCRLASGEDVLLKCEYSKESALVAVYQPCRFMSIGDPAPELIPAVLAAIRTVYPQAEIVGEEQFIRVVF